MTACRTDRIAILLAVICGVMTRASADDQLFEQVSHLQNEHIRIEVDKSCGGSIGHFADVRTGENVINTHDYGRWVGQSYYSGPLPFGRPHSDWPDWPWNPVSTGDVYGNSSALVELRNDGETLYVKSIPRQWALNDVPADCTLETWISLHGRAARIRCRLINRREDKTQYPAMNQELPAVYAIQRLSRLVTYSGDRPFENEQVDTIASSRPGPGNPHWTGFTSGECWSALVDESGWGLGLVRPGVTRFLGGIYRPDNKNAAPDDATGYIAAVRREILDHDLVYEYEYFLILGTIDEIRSFACNRRTPSPLPEFRFRTDRRHWWHHNAVDDGRPQGGGWTVRLPADDPQLHSPDFFIHADDTPEWQLHAAFHSDEPYARIYWRTREDDEYSNANTAVFPVVPDGRTRTYRISLADRPGYHGIITGLRIDPQTSGSQSAWIRVESLTGGESIRENTLCR